MKNIRLTHGLHWRSTNPSLYDYPVVKTYAIRFLIIFLAWGWAMDRDYRDQAEARAEHAEKVLLQCMNGEARFIAETQTEAVICEKAWVLKI